jgi:hypothetical protein
MFEPIDELICKIKELEKQRDTDLLTISIAIHRNDLILQIRHAAEMGEAVVQDIHTRIESLLRVGYFVETIFLGEKIWQKPASDLPSATIWAPFINLRCGPSRIWCHRLGRGRVCGFPR